MKNYWVQLSVMSLCLFVVKLDSTFSAPQDGITTRRFVSERNIVVDELNCNGDQGTIEFTKDFTFEEYSRGKGWAPGLRRTSQAANRVAALAFGAGSQVFASNPGSATIGNKLCAELRSALSSISPFEEINWDNGSKRSLLRRLFLVDQEVVGYEMRSGTVVFLEDVLK